jgi:hypothetical protein
MANVNTTMFQQTKGKLGAAGNATAVFNTTGPVSPAFLGRTVTFSYVLLAGPATRPVTYASLPVLVNFIP